NKPWPRPPLGSLTRPSLGSVSMRTSTPPNCRIIQPTSAVGCYRDGCRGSQRCMLHSTASQAALESAQCDFSHSLLGNSAILKVATVRRKSSEGADRGLCREQPVPAAEPWRGAQSQAPYQIVSDEYPVSL